MPLYENDFQMSGDSARKLVLWALTACLIVSTYGVVSLSLSKQKLTEELRQHCNGTSSSTSQGKEGSQQSVPAKTSPN